MRCLIVLWFAIFLIGISGIQSSNDLSPHSNALNGNQAEFTAAHEAKPKSPVLKKRKRLRKKKKLLKAAKGPSQDLSAVMAPTKELPSNSSVPPRRRKLKRRRNRIKNSSVKATNTTRYINTKARKSKKTRCSVHNGGCQHICHLHGPSTDKCGCFKGYALGDDRHSCIDIDECATDNGGCQMRCINTMGSHHCQCSRGFRLNKNRKSCEDINECLLRNGHGPCQDTCKNVPGGYRCTCDRFKGAKLGSDGHSCVDVDECAAGNGNCSHICINTFGRSFCACPLDMELSEDSKTCL